MLITLVGTAFYFHWFEQPLFKLVTRLLHHSAKPSWQLRLHQAGIGLIGLGIFLAAAALIY